MLKYSNIIQQLSNSDKIRILCDIQHLSDKKYKLLGIPSLKIATEEDLRSVRYPTPIALAGSWDKALIQEVAVQQMQEMASDGVDLVILSGPRPKIDPYQAAISEDPLLSVDTVTAYTTAAEQNGISVCLDGFYLTEQDMPWMDIHPDQVSLQQFWVVPYAKVLSSIDHAVLLTQESPTADGWEDINAGLIRRLTEQLPEKVIFSLCQKVNENTVSHLVDGGLCLSGSALLLEAALNRYFRLCSDIRAGTATAEDLDNELAAAQAISPETLDEATDRLLDFVFSIKRKPSVSATPADPTLCQRAALSTVTLLKNENVLPLNKKQKVCIIGDMIFHRRADHGATVSELYAHLRKHEITVTGTARGYDLNADRSEAMLPTAIELAKTADVILLFLGLGQHRERECKQRRRISIPANQHALLDHLSRLGKKIIALAPPEYCPDLLLVQRCAAVILSPLDTAYCAHALGDILIGQKNPMGKLAATVYPDSNSLFLRHQTAKHRDRIKAGPFIGYRYYASAGSAPDFPFGHGLSYSKFTYSKLTVANGIAQLTISNNSKFPATEIVQLYIGKPDSSVLRPKKELAGYAPVTLDSGKSTTVQIPLSVGQVYDPQANSFVTEAGTYILYACASVSDIRLNKKFSLEGQIIPPVNFKISDYIQSESNIISDHFKLEANHTTMKKSVFNFISGGLAMLLACVLKIYCLASNVSSTFFDIFCFILAAAGVYFFILEAIHRSRSHNEQQEIINESSKAEFTATKANSIPVYAADQMFVAEFDAPETQLADETAEVAVSDEVDALAFVDKEQTFAGAARDLALFAEERGCRINADNCIDLFASLSASRLLVLHGTDSDTFQKLMLTLSSYFETPLYLDQVSQSYTKFAHLWTRPEEKGDRRKTEAFSALNAARSNPDKIYLVALDNVDPAQLPQYFTPCVKYARNPHGEYAVTLSNFYGSSTTYRIPQNIWFVLNLAEDKSLSALPSFISDVAVCNHFTIEQCTALDVHTQIRKFNYYQMDYLADKAADTADISEDHWKKIDRLEKSVSADGHTIIDNKAWLCLEKYAYTYLTCENDVTKALDHAICSKLLLTLMAASHADTERSLAEILEQILGEDGSVACKKLLHDCSIKHA